ncbi:MAG: sigma-70 family RNA polymerase sigma factor [Clostridia bacterium]|jgi:RNA polymerase sigma-B factor|nr:sigma-70 family RNA polymerase sigma factor [Clostridia bacterium]
MEDGELFKRYRETGDIADRNRIVEKYLYIASVLAKKFVGRGVEYDDLFQVASLALMKGVERFDESKGLQFSTFITPTITGEIKNYFRDRSRLVHLPRRVAELRVKIKRAADELLTETGKKPTAQQLAQRLNVTEEEIVRAMEAGAVVSLDRNADQDGEDGMSFYEVLASEDNFAEQLENRDMVVSAVKKLNDTEKEIIRCRFDEELSQTETARRMGVSQMFVSRMERKILDKLKNDLKKSMAD